MVLPVGYFNLHGLRKYDDMAQLGLYGENLVMDHLQGSDGWPLLGHTFDYLIDTYAFGKRMRAVWSGLSQRGFLSTLHRICLS